jgi:peptidoglycan/LPS O-acetylase OafA/YrhL
MQQHDDWLMNSPSEESSNPANVTRAVVQGGIRTLADGLKSRKDNFLLLRFIAASMVIYGHGSAITGGPGRAEFFVWMGWGTYSGDIAVDIFFIVSGFMITGSYLRRQHLGDFLWARVLRIFPAFLFCLVLSAYVLGPLITDLSMAGYLHMPELAHYVLQNAKLQTTMDWTLPGVFAGNPKNATINGAIWTLPAEFRMYLWIAILGVIGTLSRRWLVSAIIVIFFGIGIVYPTQGMGMIPDIYLRLAGMFGLGTLFYIHREHVPVGWPYAAASALAAYLLRHTPIYPFAFGLAVAQFSFAFAYATPWYGFNRFGDYSYGVYLWGWPMQQVIAHAFPMLSPIRNAALAFPLALVMAVISWHLVERPTLKLKSVPASLWARSGLMKRSSGVD